MNREIHVRICESLRGQFPRATRPKADFPIVAHQAWLVTSVGNPLSNRFAVSTLPTKAAQNVFSIRLFKRTQANVQPP